MRGSGWARHVEDHAVAEIAARAPDGVELGVIEAIVTRGDIVSHLPTFPVGRLDVWNALQRARMTPGITTLHDGRLVVDEELARTFHHVRRAVARFEVHRLLYHWAKEDAFWAPEISRALGFDVDVVVRALQDLGHDGRALLTRSGWRFALNGQLVEHRASVRVPVVASSFGMERRLHDEGGDAGRSTRDASRALAKAPRMP